MDVNLFDFDDYKKYLNVVLDTTGETRGQRSKLAAAIGCGTAFVSQVLQGNVHFSLEAMVTINEFLGHSEDEAHYFMLLAHLGRAGSKKLELYYLRQIQEIQKKRQIISTRIGKVAKVSEKDQLEYYSSWIYVAVYVSTSIKKIKSKSELARCLGLSVGKVSECLDFLERSGLIQNHSGGWEVTSRRIHLTKDSPLIARHHTNWRNRAIQALNDPCPEDTHFSGAWTLSEADVKKVKDIFLSAIEKSEAVLRDSPEEAGFGVCLDFFRLTRF